MHTTLNKILTYVRMRRNFDPEVYLTDKFIALDEFLYRTGIDSVVLGVSGGIDSAVVYKMMLKLAKISTSKLCRVQSLFMPIYCKGTTGQSEARDRAYKLITESGMPFNEFDLTASFSSMILEGDLKPECEVPWALGQCASIIRTPVLYYQAAVLQTMGYKSIVCGTTNRDEGSYIGFFGKASDAMVDLQPIADIHKSEVIQLAKYLEVPQEILDVSPKGDVHDGRCDEEMIGAPYWFLELYLLLKEWGEFDRLKDVSGQESINVCNWTCNIENIHKTNAHKYEVGSPAHFVDVLPRKIPGGWQ